MKSLYFVFISLLFTSTLFAQAQKTNGQSGLPKQINFSDPSLIDYDVHLFSVDQHVIPSAEYGNKKEELNKLRELHQQKKKIEARKKTRGLAPNPMIIKGLAGNPANSVPNDNDIAVSNDGKVVSVVNSNMRVYDDTLKLLQSKSLTALVAPIGVFSWISDPRVLYDPKEDRFILVCFSGNLSTESTILVGFTQTNDPMGTWNFYTLNGNSFNDSTWSDYPIIAISDKDLFMTFNQVKDNVSWTVGFKQSVIWQIAKDEGYNALPLQYTLWSNINYNGAPLRNICPAKYQTTMKGDNLYFLTLRNVAPSNDSIFLTEITNSYQSGTAALQQKLLISPTTYGFPPNAVQKSSTGIKQYLMTNDARVLAAIYENDYVHFGSNTLNPVHVNAGVMLGQIKNISGASPIVTADILSCDSIEYGYPSMAYLGNAPNEHKVLYTFSHCYVDSFPGTSILYKDANGNYSDIIAAKNGISYINVLTDSSERWGDYTNIQKKYNTNGRAYLTGSWGKGGGMSTWLNIIENADLTLSTPNIIQQSENIIYPNPASARMNATFNLDKAEHVKFELYDLQGKRIALFLDTYTKAGKNEFSFSTQPLSAGNYVLKISTKEKVLSTHKVVVGE